MVLGCSIAVTAVFGMNQCAETTRIARGRGKDSPIAFQARVYRLSSIAFIGLPCPTKTAGILVLSLIDHAPDQRMISAQFFRRFGHDFPPIILEGANEAVR